MRKINTLTAFLLGSIVLSGFSYQVAQAASVTVTAPIGGSYDTGDNVTIKWTTSGFPISSDVDVYVYKLKAAAWDAGSAGQYLSESGQLGNVAPYDLLASVGEYRWNIPSSVSDGYYAVHVRVYDYTGDTLYQSNEDWSENFFSIGDPPVVTPNPIDTTARPEGSNILAPDGTVYRILGGVSRSPYTSAGAFLSYKFNTWASTLTANSADLALPVGKYTPTGSTQETTYFIPPRNGSLINDNGTIWLITGGLRAGFANEAAFKGMGYSYSNVYPGDTSFMLSLAPINTAEQKHPNGTLINDNGTMYVMQNGFRVAFPTMEVLDSWGYWAKEAVPANSYDRQSEISGVMQTRMANQLNI